MCIDVRYPGDYSLNDWTNLKVTQWGLVNTLQCILEPSFKWCANIFAITCNRAFCSHSSALGKHIYLLQKHSFKHKSRKYTAPLPRKQEKKTSWTDKKSDQPAFAIGAMQCCQKLATIGVWNVCCSDILLQDDETTELLTKLYEHFKSNTCTDVFRTCALLCSV